jgi:hypothetical protein
MTVANTDELSEHSRPFLHSIPRKGWSATEC